MDRLKKRILHDIVISRWTIVPLAVGLGALAAAWGLGGNTGLYWLGGAGIAGSLAALITRFTVGAEKIAQNVYTRLHDQERRERERQLDALDRRLAAEPDPRTEDCLRELRRLYDGFQADVESGKLTSQSRLLADRVEQVFHASTEQLQRSYDLWTAAQRARGEAKQAVLEQREAVIEEVISTVKQLARTIEQFHQFQTQRGSSELERLRAELDETLLVARRTEERLAEIEHPQVKRRTDFEAKE